MVRFLLPTKYIENGPELLHSMYQSQIMKATQGILEAIQAMTINQGASIKNLETQIG
jgi:cytoplasmic iron level regulating protein YaaA (DUF328/UPF0246 family)